MWGGPASAVGKRLRMGMIGPWTEVIGVAQDVYDSGVDQKAPAIVYWRAGVQRGPGIANDFVPRSMAFAIRSARTGSEDFVKQIAAAVWSVNKNLPLARIQTLGEIYAQSMSRTAFMLVMLAIAGSMALVLGIVGIYGVISYGVAQRSREVGIRIALGARNSEVRRMFLRQGLAMTAIGIAVGLAGAFALSRWMSSLLFGVSPKDPVTYAAVSLVLIIAAALACYLPACRATRVDPMESLRAE
jgi:ABC-type antimicrobial peptide transport system permease subunit